MLMPLLALFLLLCLSFLVYLPGLGGPFFLDDFAAIAAIENYGGIKDWETFKLFVFGMECGKLISAPPQRCPHIRPDMGHLTFRPLFQKLSFLNPL